MYEYLGFMGIGLGLLYLVILYGAILGFFLWVVWRLKWVLLILTAMFFLYKETNKYTNIQQRSENCHYMITAVPHVGTPFQETLELQTCSSQQKSHVLSVVVV